METNSIISLGNPIEAKDIKMNELQELLNSFMQHSCTRTHAQVIVAKLTTLLMENFFRFNKEDERVLVPILRAGIAMWTSANQFFNSPESIFITCRKNKGTNEVTSMPALQNPIKAKSVLILDTVAATGDTLCHVVAQFAKHAVPNQTIEIATCFASPVAIDKISSSVRVDKLSTVFIMKGVDAEGYLIPNLGGDVGDKLYGIQV